MELLALWTRIEKDICIVAGAARTDNRGIGNSSIPQSYGAYRTQHMAADALALMQHLGWGCAHVLGMSLGGAFDV